MKVQLSQNKILLAALLIGTIFLFIRFFSYLSFPESDYNFLGKDKKVKLDPKTSIMQIFEAKENGLDQIKIVMGNIDRLPLNESVLLELRDPQCEQVLAEDTINWLTESPKIYYRFRFPRIDDSIGKKYCLKISYEANTKRGGERPSIAVSDDDQFSDRAYTDTSNGKTYIGRTLQIRPSYSEGSLTGNLIRLENRLSQYKPEFIKGWILTIGFLMILGSVLLGIIVIRTKE